MKQQIVNERIYVMLEDEIIQMKLFQKLNSEDKIELLSTIRGFTEGYLWGILEEYNPKED